MGIIILLTKIIRRLGLGDWLLPKLQCLLKKEVSVLSVEDAKQVLNKYHKDPNTTCIGDNKIAESLVDLHIIVPVYNVEQYIEECIESLLHQNTQYSYLITIVNDGSPDRSRELLHAYESEPKIEIIDQENRGFSGARNRGLERLKGRYITFVDSDDKLSINAVEVWLSKAYRCNSDIVFGGIYSYKKDSAKPIVSYKDIDSYADYRGLAGFACGKIIKSQLFEKLKFPEGYWFEDTIMALLLYPNCQIISSVPEFVYYYRSHDASISHTSKYNYKSIDTYYITELVCREQLLFGINKGQVDYEIFLSQLKLNYRRIVSLDKGELGIAMFRLSQDLKKKYWQGFRSTSCSGQQLEHALNKGLIDYYKAICLLS